MTMMLGPNYGWLHYLEPTAAVRVIPGGFTKSPLCSFKSFRQFCPDHLVECCNSDAASPGVGARKPLSSLPENAGLLPWMPFSTIPPAAVVLRRLAIVSQTGRRMRRT